MKLQELLQLDWRTVLNTDTFLGAVLIGLLVLITAWLLSALLGSLMHRHEGAITRTFSNIDQTVFRYLLHLKTIIVFIVALFFFASVIPSLRTFLGSLTAGAGITAVVLGFAAKSTLSNLVSGVMLAIYRPIHIGDTVTIDDHYGTIEDITLRHTILLTWDHRRLVIPNEKLDSMSLINYSLKDPRMLLPVEIGVSYDTDLDLARHLMLDEIARCPHKIPDRQAPAEPWVRVVNLAESSVTMRLYVWTPDMSESWAARFWLLENIKKRFDREGVEIPYPYRTQVYKKDLPAPRKAPLELLDSPKQSDDESVTVAREPVVPAKIRTAWSRILSRWFTDNKKF
jgi:small-conductance mechanosensitive channel